MLFFVFPGVSDDLVFLGVTLCVHGCIDTEIRHEVHHNGECQGQRHAAERSRSDHLAVT